MQTQNKNFIASIAVVAIITGALTFFSACFFYSCEEKIQEDIKQTQQIITADTQMATDTQNSKQDEESAGSDAEQQNDPYEFWTTYTSDVQGFSFMYPPMYVVSESEHWEDPNMRTVSVIQTDKAGNLAPPPAMQIHVWVDAGIIQATLWEGIPFRHYENILHSFSFNGDKTSF